MTTHLSEKTKLKINDLLSVIAEDEDLCEKIAKAIGEDVDTFVDWVHNTEV
tara:strand:+ start:664 stop:816 length:153 start_codon:yes stop_codon:yes gene_type:complete